MAEGPSTHQPSRIIPEPHPATLEQSETVALFERQILVFPLFVVLLACTSFLFGGRCAAWQWWTGVAAVVLVPFVRRAQWRSVLGASGLFALLLFALRYLLPPIFWDATECDDMSSCHLPMVQLLIEGWNPVDDPTTEAIVSSLGLDIWGMAPLHIAFMPKTLAVFSAVAYTFTGDPRALTFPLPAFLWLGVLLTALRLFHGFPKWALVSSLIGVLPLVAWQMPVDLSLAYASCGLLLTMQDALREKEADWLALTIWGAWMVLIKPNGAFAFLVFFLVFAVVSFRQKRMGRKQLATRLASCMAFLVVLTAIFLWNPLVTSWRTFGHPLYPLRTIDAERFPVKNLTWDFDVGNDDFKKMGKAGLFAHAYLSPRATIAYYRWKLKKPDFEPASIPWTHPEYPNFSVRAGLLVLFVVLLLLKRSRPWAIAGIFLVFLTPTRYMGFTRYMPWLSSLGCLAIALSSEWAEAKMDSRLANMLSSVFAMLVGLLAASWGWSHARDIECAAADIALVRQQIRPRFSVPQETVREGHPFEPNSSGRVDQLTYRDNQCRLLVKESGREPSTHVVSAEEWMSPDVLSFLRRGGTTSEPLESATRLLAVAWGDRSLWDNNCPEVTLARRKLIWKWTEGWMQTPFGYYVPDDENALFLHEYYDEPEERAGYSSVKKFVIRSRKAFHAWFVTYPKEVWRRLSWNR